MKKLFLAFILVSITISAQNFTKADTLRGSETAFRNFWDVKKYDVSVTPNFAEKSIKGSNQISLEITKDITNPTFQIDLQTPMKADAISSNFKISDQKIDGNFIFISTQQDFKKGEQFSIKINFSGNPTIAKNAPWDGGWVFTKDEKGNPWISVADEGIGASVWLPCKDSWSDEPDQGVILNIVTPKDLVGIGNGKLISEKIENDQKIWTWEVKNPINAYSIIPSIGKYVHFGEIYEGEKGKLNCDYWVLDYNVEKAKKQFQQVPPMLKSFEYWFGPYPFYEDSYKLVETPYLGMEHQSNVAYGNHYLNGYLGHDMSGTGVGLKWDYIIIHESGHEWFANNITAKDVADMWIHEGFTDYSETLYTESLLDKNSANIYVQGLRRNIQNNRPIIGNYGVNNEGSGDMYSKGANMLHTIRQVINNDEKFRQILRGINRDFYHQTVTTKQIEDYISKKSGIDFSSVFNQYLRTVKIPTLEYTQNGKTLKFRYQNVVENFKLPIRINGNQTINPTEKWQTIKLKTKKEVVFDENYYVNYSAIKS